MAIAAKLSPLQPPLRALRRYGRSRNGTAGMSGCGVEDIRTAASKTFGRWRRRRSDGAWKRARPQFAQASDGAKKTGAKIPDQGSRDGKAVPRPRERNHRTGKTGPQTRKRNRRTGKAGTREPERKHRNAGSRPEDRAATSGTQPRKRFTARIVVFLRKKAYF